MMKSNLRKLAYDFLPSLIYKFFYLTCYKKIQSKKIPVTYQNYTSTKSVINDFYFSFSSMDRQHIDEKKCKVLQFQTAPKAFKLT